MEKVKKNPRKGAGKYYQVYAVAVARLGSAGRIRRIA